MHGRPIPAPARLTRSRFDAARLSSPTPDDAAAATRPVACAPRASRTRQLTKKKAPPHKLPPPAANSSGKARRRHRRWPDKLARIGTNGPSSKFLSLMGRDAAGTISSALGHGAATSCPHAAPFDDAAPRFRSRRSPQNYRPSCAPTNDFCQALINGGPRE